MIRDIIWGAIAGYIAGNIMNKRSKGFIINTILGLLGGFVGGRIGALLDISGGRIVSLILAVLGACIIIFIAGKLSK